MNHLLNSFKKRKISNRTYIKIIGLQFVNPLVSKSVEFIPIKTEISQIFQLQESMRMYEYDFIFLQIQVGQFLQVVK